MIERVTLLEHDQQDPVNLALVGAGQSVHVIRRAKSPAKRGHADTLATVKGSLFEKSLAKVRSSR